jgi:hypothetical protein
MIYTLIDGAHNTQGFVSLQFFLFHITLPLFPLPRMIRGKCRDAGERTSGLELQPPAQHPATACYWCKIIFHFQTWGIGFNLCPVSRLAKWKLVLVMQINAELQKADKQARTHRACSLPPLTQQQPDRQPDHVLFSVTPIALYCQQFNSYRHNWVQQINIYAEFRLIC